MREPLPSKTELIIDNDIAQLAILRQAMEDIGTRHGLAPKPLFQLQVALDEMVSNVIKYGWPEGGSHQVRVCIAVGSGRVQVDITDDGKAFDPLGVPAPKPPPPGQRPRTGGLGIHLVRQIMERIEYSRADGLNCLTMTKLCDVGREHQQQGTT